MMSDAEMEAVRGFSSCGEMAIDGQHACFRALATSNRLCRLQDRQARSRDATAVGSLTPGQPREQQDSARCAS